MSLPVSGRSSKRAVVAPRRSGKPEERRALLARERASRVERAKQLARNPRYPSKDVVESLARLFARHLSAQFGKSAWD